MFSVLVATRMVINVARYPLSNVITRSFIACPRVAYVKSKTASPEPTTQPSETPTAAPAKGGRKPKEPKLEPTSKPNPKKGKPFSVQDTPCMLICTVAIPENLKPPKRPSSPYLLFVRDYLQKNPRSSDKEPPQVKFKECGAEWRALPDAEKEVPFYSAYLQSMPVNALPAIHTGLSPRIRRIRQEERSMVQNH